MKDAFGIKLEIGSKVIYSTGVPAGNYVVGTISKLIPSKPKPGVSYYPPDRVSVSVHKNSTGAKATKEPILYASNVVAIDGLR